MIVSLIAALFSVNVIILSDTSKILAIFPHHGLSHHMVYLPYFQELANRGHHITVISHYSFKHPNITDVSILGSMPMFNNKRNISPEEPVNDVRYAWKMIRLFYTTGKVNEAMFSVDGVRQLLNGQSKYDLLITEHFNNELALVFAFKFNIPFILVSSCNVLPWNQQAVGQPYEPAIKPSTLTYLSPKMNLYNRAMNTIATGVQLLGYAFLCRKRDEEIIKKQLNINISLKQLVLNASLIFVNTHYTMFNSIPLVPAVVEVGGIHIKPAKLLPKCPAGLFCANILGVFPIEAPSHQVVFDAYMSELHRRGHNVTVYSHFPDMASEQYARVRISNASALDPDYVTMDRMHSPSALNSYAHMFHMLANSDAYAGSDALRELYAQPADAYDLIVTETCNTDLYLALVHRFAAPFVAWTTSPMFVWSADRVAAPTHPAYVPVLMTPHGPRMDFAQRAANALLRSAAFYEYFVGSSVPSQRVASEHYASSPPLSELAFRTRLLFVDTHHTVWGSRPLPPSVVEVGGLHVKPSSPLEEDIQEYIDEAEHGVIYFCMGSLLRGETFPAEKRQMFLNVFKKLPQRILWKWESEQLPGKPSNVMLRKWMPQRDILAHPNVKLFISHGGLLGTTEAVYEGVPILSIPIFGDQMTNVKAVVDKGAAEMMYYGDLNEDEIFTKIKSMLTNPKYRQKAKELSVAFRDRPMSPMDTAVYWTEYVIRHKGAPHIQSAAVRMPWYQYYLIDVLLVIFTSIASFFMLLYCLIFKVLLRSTNKKVKQKLT